MHSAPEKQTPNPAWAFNLDPVHSWAYWDKAFYQGRVREDHRDR
jgi:hypothetical protein